MRTATAPLTDRQAFGGLLQLVGLLVLAGDLVEGLPALLVALRKPDSSEAMGAALEAAVLYLPVAVGAAVLLAAGLLAWRTRAGATLLCTTLLAISAVGGSLAGAPLLVPGIVATLVGALLALAFLVRAAVHRWG
jgi:spore maturation protein SpmA